MSTFVLVHGGWRGGWVWQRVARLLRAEGHDVYTPTMTGLGERHHLRHAGVNLSTHIEDIRNVIEFEDLDDIILCGHSYAGMVITGVADAISHRIRALVYLDAWVPENGMSVLSFVPPGAMYDSFIGGTASLGGLACPPLPSEIFNLNENDREMVERKCTPHPFASMLQTITLSGDYQTVGRRMFVQASDWAPSPFVPFFERLREDKKWLVRTIESGHDAMLDQPDAVARVLLEADLGIAAT